MKLRHVYLADSMESAKRCVQAAQALGWSEDRIALVASADTPLDQIPDDLKEGSSTDFMPATVRGALGGGAVGLAAGLVGAVIPAIGITLAGAGLMAVAGAAVGTWSSALVGASVPNEVHRRFEDKVADGHVLVVLDAEEKHVEQLDRTMAEQGAKRFDYEVPSLMT
ncbi:hypothetical protein [Pseudomarimonas arenosa]|uniref:DUF1269 domain-containing protein n=1 Tax=Pseudomarimonas arenosa TaxID=2774145 RepID=A0AAW3ZNI6_9GAMM|nr:hypothetical protein [Pseudomarimonas arenosa]MBD8526734.1 hypothetical protein [Pseudomarimonas arenosa]